MFIQAALLLLLAHAFSVQSFNGKDLGFENSEVSKTQKILKNVGKRFYADYIHRSIKNPNRWYLTERSAFEGLSEEDITRHRKATMKHLAFNIITATSNRNVDYKNALRYVENLLMPEFTATICDQEPLNSYEFMKYMTQNSAQFAFNFESDRLPKFIVEPSDRNHLHFQFNFTMGSHMAGRSLMKYDVHMKPTLERRMMYHILNLTVTGSCPNDAKYEGTRVDNELSAQNETVMWFKGLFVPKFPDWYDSDPDNLPTKWLDLLKAPKPGVKFDLNVCHEKSSESMNYTVDQFISWYKHFGMMWAVSDDDNNFEHQLFFHLDDHIAGRVTMKLQMRTRRDAPVLDWQFKYSANHFLKEWMIQRVEVLCNVKVEYKDESYKHIRDIIMERFVDEIEDFGTNTTMQWYSTVDFIKMFTKHGQVRMHWCDRHKVTNITQLELFTYVKGQKYNTRFVRYSFDKKEMSLPAPDTDEIRFKTISEADIEKPEYQVEHEWVFHIKWDVMDQFYYIDKLTMECGKEMRDGEYTAANYNIFNFGGKRRHRK